jgi:membrane peptidoglycan carboxypeptidase
MGADRPVKWIANYDNQFRGPMPIRQALAESRNAVAVWITREIGLEKVISTSREMGIRMPLAPYITTALGASEVRLWNWRTPIAPWPRVSWRSLTSSIASLTHPARQSTNGPRPRS